MEYLRLVDEAQVQFFKGQAGVRSGLAGEGELPVAVLIKGDEGQRGEHIVGGYDSPGLNPRFFQGAQKHFSEGVGSHLPQQGGFGSELGQGCQEIGGSAAGMGRHGGIAVGIRIQAREIDEQFSQRDYINHITFLTLLSDIHCTAAGKEARPPQWQGTGPWAD